MLFENAIIGSELTSKTYIMNAIQIIQFMSYLYGVGVSDPIRVFWEKMVNKTSDAVLSVCRLPFLPEIVTRVPTLSASPVGVTIGNETMTGVTGKLLPRSFKQIYRLCTFTAPAYYDSNHAWAEYEPYSTYDIYIPFSGFHRLNAVDVVGKTIEVDYIIRINESIAAAVILVDGNEKYRFDASSMFVQIPLSEKDTEKKLFSALSGVLSGAMGAASGNIGSLVSGAANGLGAVLTPSHTQALGSLSSSVDSNMQNECYIIATRTPLADADGFSDYLAHNGAPLNEYRTLATLSGWTEMQTFHADIPGATDAEKTEIESMMKTGVIL